MSKGADSIRRGLNEAVAHAKGEAAAKAYRVHVPQSIDVKAIRAKLHMVSGGVRGPVRLQHQHATPLGAGRAPARRTHARVSHGHGSHAQSSAKGLGGRMT